MVRAVPDILARIVEHKRAELVRDSARRGELERRADARTDYRDFRAALIAHPPAIIGEIKKASPSKGVLAEEIRSGVASRECISGAARPP